MDNFENVWRLKKSKSFKFPKNQLKFGIIFGKIWNLDNTEAYFCGDFKKYSVLFSSRICIGHGAFRTVGLGEGRFQPSNAAFLSLFRAAEV